MAHIKKRTYERRNGKVSTYWRATYTAPDGRNRTRQFDRKVDAQAWLDLNGADVLRGEWFDPDKAGERFATWVADWKATMVDLRPSTLERDLGYVDRYIVPTFGHMTLGQIDHMAVQTWITTLTKTGPDPWWDATDPKNAKRRTKPLAPATAVKAAQIMGKIMATAVTARKIKWNPCTDLKLPKMEREEMRFLAVDEVDALADAIDLRYRAMVYVAAYGGLRIGELAGLRRGSRRHSEWSR